MDGTPRRQEEQPVSRRSRTVSADETHHRGDAVHEGGLAPHSDGAGGRCVAGQTRGSRWNRVEAPQVPCVAEAALGPEPSLHVPTVHQLRQRDGDPWRTHPCPGAFSADVSPSRVRTCSRSEAAARTTSRSGSSSRSRTCLSWRLSDGVRASMTETTAGSRTGETAAVALEHRAQSAGAVGLGDGRTRGRLQDVARLRDVQFKASCGAPARSGLTT